MNENLTWLKTLTPQQLMALGAQHGLNYTQITIHGLQTLLARKPEITKIRESMRGVDGVCCET